MRLIQKFLALVLGIALLAPAAGFAQSRGHGHGKGHAKAKVERPHHPEKAEKTHKAHAAKNAKRPKAQKVGKAPKAHVDRRPAKAPKAHAPKRVHTQRQKAKAAPKASKARIERPDRRIRRARSLRLERDTRLLRERFGPRVVRTTWVETTDLPFFVDPFGHRIARAPVLLVDRIDRAYVVMRRLDPYRPPSSDLVRIDFGLDYGGPYRPTGPDNLLEALALPVALLVTDALVDDVDHFVTTQRFATYDSDFDGYVAPAEWTLGAPTFSRYDADGDGYLVPRELYGDDDLILVDRDRLFYFQGLDRDGDGLVAPWEWPGDLESFWFRDDNADGAVSLDEYLGLEVDRPVRDLEFDAIDYDRDGEIARVEWVGNPYRFERLDGNGNGVVGRWEYAYGWLRGA